MQKTVLFALFSFGISTLITGCGQSIPYVNENTEAECTTINQNLLKVNTYIQTVENTSAFHLEESSVAMLEPKMTRSNNKQTILKDAAKRKASLEAEYKRLGCKASVK